MERRGEMQQVSFFSVSRRVAIKRSYIVKFNAFLWKAFMNNLPRSSTVFLVLEQSQSFASNENL